MSGDPLRGGRAGIAAAVAARTEAYGPLHLARAFERQVTRKEDEKVSDLVDLWRSSPDWELLSEQTRRVYNIGLRKIINKLGEIPLRIVDNPRMHPRLLAWRASLASTPAATDNLLTVLSSLLRFGIMRGKLRINVASGIGDLYCLGRRAHVIWSDEELAIFVQTAEELGREAIADAALLAAETGLRRADLISVCFGDLRECSIVKQLQKAARGRHPVAQIPRTEALNQVLRRIMSRPRAEGVENLLVNHHGQPWQDYNLEIGFRLIRNICGIGVFDPKTGGFEPKRLHDLRGTKATKLLTQTDLTDEEIALILGWSPEWVAKIRWVYVDDRVRVEALGRQLVSSTYKLNTKLFF